jgi:formylglycine-generating enzyme required for sulfatase activity
MRAWVVAMVLVSIAGISSRGEDVRITGFQPDGNLTWTCPSSNTVVYRVEAATDLGGRRWHSPWANLTNIVPTGAVMNAVVPMTNETMFYRMAARSAIPSGMVLIPSAGTSFIMGDNNPVGSNTNQMPAHQVNFTYDYFLDKCEVSWGQWKIVYNWATNNGYKFESYAADGAGDNYPVYKIGWNDCVKWCNARSQMEGLTPVYYRSSTHASNTIVKSGISNSIPPANCIKDCNGYRLPTEAEWEYAARGGTAETYYAYGNTLDSNYSTFAPSSTWVEVTANLPGNFGLYNMSGNVYEWCYELFYQYTADPQTDPWAPGELLSPKDHISRGGDFMSEAWRTACCARKPYSDNWARTKPINDLQHGFRCARSN